MPQTTFDELFHYLTIEGIVSNVARETSRFQDFYGLGIGGPNEQQVGGKSTAWDIFDYTRTVSRGRATGAGPTQIKPQKVGTKAAVMYRTFEYILLDYEMIYRKRGLGMSMGTIDTMGQKYVAKQIAYLGQRAKNHRELMISEMFKGGFDLSVTGDDLVPVALGSGSVSIDYGLPAANKTTVNSNLAGNWQTTASADVLGELLKLNKYSAQTTRFPISHCWVNGTAAGYILKNAGVQAAGGTANQVFLNLDTGGVLNEAGQKTNYLTFTLRGYPLVTFHVYDDGWVDDSGTFNAYIPNGKAIFTPDPSPLWLEYRVGSEPIKENVVAGVRESRGTDFWVTEQMDPAAVSLKNLSIGLPTPYVYNWFYGTIHA